MQFAWRATGTVIVDLDESEHTFIVVTQTDATPAAVDVAMKALLDFSKGDSVKLELTELDGLGPVARIQ